MEKHIIKTFKSPKETFHPSFFRAIVFENSEKGISVAIPREKDNDGKYYNTAYPYNEETKQQIEVLSFRLMIL